MSRRDRIRRKNRSEKIIEPGPRVIKIAPPTSKFSGRVRNPYNDKPVDITSRYTLRKIDTGNNLHDFRTKKNLQVHDNVTFRRYIPRNEVVKLPSEHPICRQREERRKVMFAIRKTGMSGQKSPRLPNIVLKCVK